MRELTIVIPSRNEEFLLNTIQDILKNKRADTEIIVGLDGELKHFNLIENPDVTIIHYPDSIGQRAITNQCVKLARGKYIMKVDAHCAFDEGFDRKMLDGFKESGDNVAMVPVMRNLWIFDWKCPVCGKRVYQDKVNKCPPNERHKEEVEMKKKMLWIAKHNPQSSAYCFTPEPKFEYFGALREKHKKDPNNLVETMSLQGSAFMCSKDKYWELNVCDEAFGSWGSQGIEVACKFWLSGGRVLTNKATWYAHCFRTKNVFGFPYKLSGNQVTRAKHLAKDLFFNKKWPLQKHKLSWLIEKFWPIKGWTEESLRKLKEEEIKQNA
jgi:glycosyltransferase involved in cell wall biosynthesis